MKMIKMLFCVSIYLSSTIAFAQLKDIFEKGSIIQNEGEKIEGFIKNDDLSKLSSEICFKLLESDEKCSKFDVTQIKSFQTESGKIFELLTVKMDKNTKEISVFANLILKGEASLYKSVYNAQDFYIISNKNTNYVLQNDELISGETEERKYNYLGIINIATEGQANTDNRTQFNESNFIKIVTDYNTLKGSKSDIVNYKEKNITYKIVNVGYGFKNNQSEFFLQAMYRMYFPIISRSTSLNTGFNYFNYQESEFKGNKKFKFKQQLVSIPFQIQQNILNKSIRPYVFGGLNLSYLKVVDDINNTTLKSGLQSNFGVGLLYGAGIEVDVYKGLMLKSELRNEIFFHLVLFGIGYNFSK
jgi:hypothetical protein